MRRLLHVGHLGLVEHYSVSAPNAPPKGFSPDFQFAIPVFGALGWRVGKLESLVDANTGLFIRGGEEFSEEHPIPGIGHSGLIVTPSATAIDELGGGRKDKVQEIFATDTRPASAKAQMLAHRLVGRAESMTQIEIEEHSIEFMHELIRAKSPPAMNGTQKVINRAKEVLHELDCEPLTLADVASQVGVTPIYLTQAFKRSEGIPLYRYQSRLRLSRALAELPFNESLTALALDLGFSSHSHFAAVFRSVFDVSPSCYRSEFLQAA
ncbi:MAG: helix-turn-helix transcriptional regulator [Sphingorhabdus sp.]|uniref:helix-turn-helix transcriptional regulator n=1 Tax=Sphingorhabdus sp. TaxID=1902408 RepID=UPI003CA56AA1